MGKTKISPRKLVTSRGIFHAKMGMINDRNSKDLTEAKEIKKSWQGNSTKTSTVSQTSWSAKSGPS